MLPTVMPFSIPSSIEKIPEIASLPPSTRAEMLAAADAPGPWRLWSYNASRGLITTVILIWLGHDAVYRDLPTSASMVVIAMLIATTTYLWHFWTITRIRGRIRAGIAAAATNERTPICLRCGYDCAATDADACPECGTRLLIPPRRSDRDA